MSIEISNPISHLNKRAQFFRMSTRDCDSFSHCLKSAALPTSLSLLFNYHIVHYDTSFHDISDFFTFPSFSRSTNNGKTGLQNSKGSFHIFPSPLLLLRKSFMLS